MERLGLGSNKGHWLLTQAQDLVENQKVVQVDSESTVEEACDALIEHKIQSVPLYDSRSHSYVGMFDLHDLAAYILAKRETRAERTRSSSIGSDSGNSSPLVRKVTGSGRNIGGDMVSKISDLSHMNPFYSVVPETTVAQATQVFAKGAHRVAVMQDERTIRGILSQARVVRYFFERAASADGATESEQQLLDSTLESLKLVSRDVVCATADMPVVRALSLLESWHISSIAIVDEERRLVGNLSLTDVKYLARERQLVRGSCMELVRASRFLQGVQDGQDKAAVFSVRPQATLRYVLAKLIATGAHRIWITEPGAHPDPITTTPVGDSLVPPYAGGRRASVSSSSSQTVGVAPTSYAGAFGDVVCGVVSLTDILRLLAENAPKPPADPEYNYASMD
ncbi:cell separation during budding [Coemansia guatemalensis]|uniref:Cell separation during budding n=1 Tax=Coemansia guatemalensis TaxID=2761395 RepID=A0A9W8HYT8_9FUNG|nr:cell separation during budding [Coemansia guatemalensis]